jgi:nucleoside-diphosphate-sugar epimerase
MMATSVFGPLNIGVDTAVKLKDVAQNIIDIIGSNSIIEYRDEHYFFSELPIPDITRASNEIGWIPIITLKEGLGMTIENLRARKELHGWG